MGKLQFPKGFKWGSAVWALGVEGGAREDGRTPTALDEHFRLNPECFFEGVGPDITLNWRNEYARFVNLAKSLGHTCFRTSIQWSRLMPDGIHVSESAVAFYRDLFQSFKKCGIELSVVLYWFDMPLHQENRGGFTCREIEDDFIGYCETCFKLFDGLVDVWYIYNEPTVDIYMKYAWRTSFPGRVSWQDICRATYNMAVVHAKVICAHRSGGYAGRVGSVLAHAHVYPRSEGELDVLAAQEDACLIHGCFEDPLLAGVLNARWIDIVERSGVELDRREGDERIIAENTIDLVGLNVYAPERVQHVGRFMSATEWMGSVLGADIEYQDLEDAQRIEDSALLCSGAYQEPHAKMNSDRGWEIYPQVMYDSIMDIEHAYPGTEVRITENGMGVHDEGRFRDKDGVIQDDYRIDYLKEHLAWAHRAIQHGANLTAYSVWSFVDLWSPSNQFKNCYGLLEFDREAMVVRQKKSAAWFKAVADSNSIKV